MPGLKFYYDLLNPRCRSVMLLLKAENLPFNGISFNQKENEAEIKNLNNLGTLPLIEDGGFKLSECSPIMKYLFRKYKLPAHWYPQNDMKKQSKINEYMSWHHFNTYLNTQMFFEHKIHILPIDYNALNKWKALTEKTLDHLEFYWLPLLDNMSNDTSLEESTPQYENGYKYMKKFDEGPNNQPHQTREINLAHLLIACQLTQTYIAGWDIVTRDRPGIVHFYANFKKRIAQIQKESLKAIQDG